MNQYLTIFEFVLKLTFYCKIQLTESIFLISSLRQILGLALSLNKPIIIENKTYMKSVKKKMNLWV